jgi:signal transduction histidine kinase
MNSELDLETLVTKLTEEATALCRAQMGAFFYNVEDEQGPRYTLSTLTGVDRSVFSTFPMPRATAIFRPAYEGTSVMRVDDVTKDPRYGQNAPYHGLPKGHPPVRSFLAVPVKTRAGAVLGALFLGHAEPRMFGDEDEKLLVAVSAHAAIAIENAKLFAAARQAEATAQREREKLHQLFMLAPAVITIMRGPDLVYEFVNRKAAELLGTADVIGKPLVEVAPADRVATLKKVFETGERFTAEGISSVHDWRGDGPPTRRYFNVVYEAFRGADDEIEGVASFAFDVTNEVLSKEELERASRMKDDFLATVSHELRTPLNAILGWTQMLRSGVVSVERTARAIETVERNAKAQAQLIDDLLDVSRINGGTLRLDVAAVDLAAVVEHAVEAVRPAATAKSIALTYEVDPGAGHLVGDAIRLQQVVWNLLANAVKFTPNGGHVSVAVHRRESAVEIVVADDGEGIDAAFLPLVFERFRQADTTPTRKQGGLGLGLAIVRHLVELHGGTVGVESAGAGRGATFVVSLPVGPRRHELADV